MLGFFLIDLVLARGSEPYPVLDFDFCNMHWKVINPLSKSILVINPFLPNFAQCAVTIWNAED